ncbi:MAG TPA: hypothetical protein VIY86_11980, partial [Pirellulaceae bacterium]
MGSDTSHRYVSIDTYRGLVMFLMLVELLQLGQLATAYPESRFWHWIQFHTTHVAWTGCSLHDLIQPSFTFLVGVSLAVSQARPQRVGRGSHHRIVHAIYRSVVLIVLGVFVRSLGK